jgi:hypothetical protein
MAGLEVVEQENGKTNEDFGEWDYNSNANRSHYDANGARFLGRLRHTDSSTDATD